MGMGGQDVGVKGEREVLLGDSSLTGGAWCRAFSDSVDGWLAWLLQTAAGSVAAHGVALAAVGGYGRAELCPASDIDVVLLHGGRSDIGDVADRIWYPIWDEGMKLGHSVRTVREALTLAADDLDTATSLLSIRHVAGDTALTGAVMSGARAQWQKRSKRWLEELAGSVRERHAAAGEVAFLLEPDLKDGRGGLRDVHALDWAEAARRLLFPDDRPGLDGAYESILAARVELQRRTAKASNQLLLQEQDAVATALGDADADVLMARVAAAARSIAWTSDETWDRVASALRGPLGRLARRDRAVGPGLVQRDGEVHVAPGASPARDPVLALRAAAVAAVSGMRIDRASLELLAVEAPAMPEPWPPEARARLVELFCAGPFAVRVVEALDQRGIWARLLPEWEAVRSRPQRNAYHRFTVDRHLVEAAVGAGALADRVERPDLLVVGALLHDLGKGFPGNHTVVGMVLARTVATRMGFDAADVDTLVGMVQHHLLLPDVATRRDLDDPGTVALVAEAVGSAELLALLGALTEADSLATGPAAWGRWKAGLVADLVRRANHVLRGGALADVVGDDFPSPEHLGLMATFAERRATIIRGQDDVLTVVALDRPGLFSRVAGTLSLHGLTVLGASAYSADGVALAAFRVEADFGPVIAWDRVATDLDRVLAGLVALDARVQERSRRYARRVPAAASPARTRVVIDNDSSSAATVVDVQAPDSVGVLYRITRALADLDLDIRSARVQTLGHQVVDSFYVCTSAGDKLTDTSHHAELERAVVHAIGAGETG